MDLMLSGEKLDLPAGTAIVMLTPIDSEGFSVTTMVLVGDSKDERAVSTLAMLARGLAYIAEEQPEDCLEAGRYAMKMGDTEYPIELLLANGVPFDEIEPEGNA